MAPSLPLPRDFFQCPILSSRESETLLETARTNSIEVIGNTKLNGTTKGIQWVLDSQDGEQLLYKGDDWDAPPGVQTYLGVVEIKATLDDVAKLYACHKAEELKDFRRTIAKDAMDIHQLYVLAAPSEDSPHHFVGVKWAVLRSAAPGIIRHRDWLFLESHHDFEWDGRRGWARATKSIELPFVPELEAEFNFIRGYQHRSGYVFLECERPGYLQAIQLHQFDLRGKVPSWFVAIGIKKRCHGFLEISKFIREQKLSNMQFLLPQQLVAKDTRSCCHSCLKRFRSVLNPKFSCQKCGEVVCQSCSKVWVVKLNGRFDDLRICTACILDTDFSTTKNESIAPSSVARRRSSERTRSYNSSILGSRHRAVGRANSTNDDQGNGLRNNLVPPVAS